MIRGYIKKANGDWVLGWIDRYGVIWSSKYPVIDGEEQPLEEGDVWTTEENPPQT